MQYHPLFEATKLSVQMIVNVNVGNTADERHVK